MTTTNNWDQRIEQTFSVPGHWPNFALCYLTTIKVKTVKKAEIEFVQ
jgi:hypothetical protein